MNEKKKRSKWIAWIPFDLGDLMAAAGVGLVVYGAFLIYRPAAAILGGVILLAIAISAHKSQRSK